MSLKIVVAGNCQVWGLSACIARRRPDWQVDTVFVGALKTEADSRTAAALAEACDLVLAQPKTMKRHKAILGGGRRRAAMLFPAVIFTGFHPDAFYPETNGGKTPSPMGGMNSRIAMAGFLLGLTVERTAGLFNALVYRRLGYFEEGPRATVFQRRLGESAGWEMEAPLARWRETGVFMHQPLHPTIAVLDDIAEVLCRSIDPGGGDQACGPLPPDQLSKEAIWPVYPEFARVLGVEGSMQFRPPVRSGVMGLEGFLDRCFRRYGRAHPSAIVDASLAQAVEVLGAMTA